MITKREETPCKECGDNYYIVNRKYQLCDNCNFKRLHEGKSKQQVYQERQKGKQKKRKVTGERALNLEIWCEREHVCSNCGGKLGDIPKVHMFTHIKSKGSRRDLRLCKENIMLHCLKCHYALDFRGTDAYNARKDINIGKYVGND